jgi:hypothetical protein
VALPKPFVRGVSTAGSRKGLFKGGVIAAESGADVHHGASRCLLRLFDAASESLVALEDYDGAGERRYP